MLNEVLSGSSAAVISGLVGFFISKKITSANFDIYVEKAKAQASAIENEAQLLLFCHFFLLLEAIFAWNLLQ